MIDYSLSHIYALSTLKFGLTMLGIVTFDMWYQYRKDRRELRK